MKGGVKVGEGSEAFCVLGNITTQLHAEVESIGCLTYIQNFNNIYTSTNFAIA